MHKDARGLEHRTTRLLGNRHLTAAVSMGCAGLIRFAYPRKGRMPVRLAAKDMRIKPPRYGHGETRDIEIADERDHKSALAPALDALGSETICHDGKALRIPETDVDVGKGCQALAAGRAMGVRIDKQFDRTPKAQTERTPCPKKERRANAARGSFCQVAGDVIRAIRWIPVKLATPVFAAFAGPQGSLAVGRISESLTELAPNF